MTAPGIVRNREAAHRAASANKPRHAFARVNDRSKACRACGLEVDEYDDGLRTFWGSDGAYVTRPDCAPRRSQ